MQPKRRDTPFVGLRTKTIFMVVSIVTIALAVSSVFFYHYSYAKAVQRYDEHMEPLQDTIVSNINYYVTNCAKSARSIYYNTSVLKLLTQKNSNFVNAETRDSDEIFSYLLSLYASVPSAVQIRLVAYQVDRSFLVTTYDLSRYMRVLSNTGDRYEYPEASPISISDSIRVINSHLITDYGHLVSASAFRNQYVFTVQIPLYSLPDSKKMIGLLSVDISTDYITEICSTGMLGTSVFIVDEDNTVIYAPERERIGKKLVEDWMSPLVPDTSHYAQSGKEVSTRLFNSAFCPWRIYIVTPLQIITRDAFTSQIVLIAVFFAVILLVTAVLFVGELRFVTVLNRMALFIHSNLFKGNYNLQARMTHAIPYKGNDEISVLIRTIDEMLETIDGVMVRQYKMELANRTSELKALQAQINPHFIYNTLQCIGTKVLENGDVDSYSTIASFGQMLQYAMNMKENVASIAREIDYVSRYLTLQALRNDDQLDFQVDGDQELKCYLIPKMTFQPMAENAVIHGLLFREKDQVDPAVGKIRIALKRKTDRLVISFENNGNPASEESVRIQMERTAALRDSYFQTKKTGESFAYLVEKTQNADSGTKVDGSSYHIGLGNVYIRFLLQFDGHCDFDMRVNNAGETVISLSIPLEYMEKETQEGRK